MRRGALDEACIRDIPPDPKAIRFALQPSGATTLLQPHSSLKLLNPTGMYPVHEAFGRKGLQVMEIGPKRGISVDLCAGRAPRSLAPPDIAYMVLLL